MVEELEEFKSEILELLESAEKALLAFEELPDNQSSDSLYNEVFRAYHNIKGAAGMLEWKELMEHVHHLENVLMQSKSTSSIPRKYISWFLKGNDATRAIMAGEPYQFSYDISDPVATEELPPEFYAEVREAMEHVSSSLMKIESGDMSKEMVNSVYRAIHTVKGASQLFELEAASKLAHAMESSLEKLRTEEMVHLEPDFLSVLLESVDLINHCVHDPTNSNVMKEVHSKVALLEKFFQEDRSTKEVRPALVKEAVENKAPLENKDAVDTTIRVQVSLLDRLMTLMGEMVLVRNQVLQYTEKCDDMEFTRLSQKLNQVTSELQDETMKTRMQPIGNILTKFQRMVRDLSASLDKKIQLKLIGTETELDKSLIEAVKDPLTHIVRNSCDHGLESPAERMSVGKNETGTITVEAYHEGGQVIVSITDDGRGLKRDKILSKAVEKGILNSAQAETLSDREILNLIFMPGFSTAGTISNVSGRGVGMDVVKSNIQKIGGLVEISSEEGAGTQIILKIPLTLAIVPALIVKAENDRYAIPQVKLVELIRVESKSIEYIQGRPVYRLRGNLLPILNIKEVFGLETAADTFKQEDINIVVLHSQTQIFGLAVDEILDTYDIVVKPLAKFLKPLSIYSGATVLGDGNVAFILDVFGIAQKHLEQDNLDRAQAAKHLDFDLEENELKEFVSIKLGSQTKHAIPLSMVNRLEEYRPDSFEYSGTQKVLRYRGQVLPIISLNSIFDYEVSTEPKEVVSIIVVNIGEQLFGVEVDQVLDIFSSRAYLDQNFTSHPCIEGNLVEDSEIVVIVNLEKIIQEYQEKNRKHLNIPGKVGKRILLVEDTESIRIKTRDTLVDAGYSVVCAVDGVDALKKLAEHKLQFDLVVSDIEMPRMNGYELVSKLRTIERMKKTPIIAFTTRNTEADLAKAKESGFTSFLEKSKFKLLNLLINECLRESLRKAA